MGDDEDTRRRRTMLALEKLEADQRERGLMVDSTTPGRMRTSGGTAKATPGSLAVSPGSYRITDPETGELLADILMTNTDQWSAIVWLHVDEVGRVELTSLFADEGAAVAAIQQFLGTASAVSDALRDFRDAGATAMQLTIVP